MHHPGHTARLGWKGARRYYERENLPVEAPEGLRELAKAEGLPYS